MDEARFFERIGGVMNAPGDAPPLTDEDSIGLRTPPHSTEAEQSLLGGLLLDAGTAFVKISESVSAKDFYSHNHRLIYLAIVALLGEGAPVDVISVYERLERDDNAQPVGGLAYLNALAQSVPSTASIGRYAEIVAERSSLRAIIGQADEIAVRAFRHDPSATILDDAKVELSRLAEARKAGSGRIPLLTLAELREQSHGAPWLIKHVLPSDSIGMLYGGSGTFKSFIAIDAALHIAHGLPWMGRRTTQGSVLYIAAEGGSGLWPRIVAWHRARRLHWKDVPLHVVPAAINLTTDAWRVVEAGQARGVTPTLVIVDTLSQTYAGEENSAGEVAAYFRELGIRFRQLWHCAVLLVHHTGHIATERPRGSSAMRSNLDFMFGVCRDEKEMLATLNCAKQKEGEGFTDATFSLSAVELGTDEDGDMVKSLVARHLAGVDDLQQAMEAESRAGRGGNNQRLLKLVQNGQRESELRTLFCADCGQDTAEGRRQAWHRAKSWAIKAGFMEISGGYVITLKAANST